MQFLSPNQYHSIKKSKTHKLISQKKENKIGELGFERGGGTHALWLADELGDSLGGLGEDGGGVDSLEVDVGGDIEARHLLFFSLTPLSLDSPVSTQKPCVN